MSIEDFIKAVEIFLAGLAISALIWGLLMLAAYLSGN